MLERNHAAGGEDQAKVVVLTVGPVLGLGGKKDQQTTLSSYTAQVLKYSFASEESCGARSFFCRLRLKLISS